MKNLIDILEFVSKDTIYEKLDINDVNPQKKEKDLSDKVWGFDIELIKKWILEDIPEEWDLRFLTYNNYVFDGRLYVGLGDPKTFGKAENPSVFTFNLEKGKLDLVRSPMIWLSPCDKSGNNPFDPRMKYMAMRGITDMRKECNLKPWRKQGYKGGGDFAKKISAFLSSSIQLMDIYTNGGYTNGTLEIPLKEAAKQKGLI